MSAASDQIGADHHGFSDAEEDDSDSRLLTGNKSTQAEKVAQALIEAIGV